MQDSGSAHAVQRNILGQDLLSNNTGSVIATVLWVALVIGCTIGITLMEDPTVIIVALVLIALSLLSAGWKWWSVRSERRLKFHSMIKP
jgi:hypothetical protein